MAKKEARVDKCIPENAKRIIREKKIKLSNRNPRREKKTKYTKQRMLAVVNGYDCLENLMLVRAYIAKRYSVDLKLLELLLYLSPKNYFTLHDYYIMPKPFKYIRISKMINDGHLNIIQKGKDKTEHIYSLSVTAKNVVVKFYKHLSGEEPIPETLRKYNPMAREDATQFDKLKLNIIKKINALPPSETKKGLFE